MEVLFYQELSSVDVHLDGLLGEELEDADIELLQIVADWELAPAAAESPGGTMAAVDVFNLPGHCLRIIQCQLLAGVGEMLPDKFRWDDLQDKEVCQGNGNLWYICLFCDEY